MKKFITLGRLIIELDTDQVIPDDPGAGTPALVYTTKGIPGHATYWCAKDIGLLSSDRYGTDDIELTRQEIDWLNSDDVENAVDEFLFG